MVLNQMLDQIRIGHEKCWIGHSSDAVLDPRLCYIRLCVRANIVLDKVRSPILWSGVCSGAVLDQIRTSILLLF